MNTPQSTGFSAIFTSTRLTSMELPARIYLLGYMGSGKSFSGKRLAKQLGYQFMDLDTLIEEEAGMSIPRIFEEHGEAFFRQLEAAILRKTKDVQRAVISCGGGTPCFHANMAWIKATGFSIYLKATPFLLAERLLPEMSHRPLIRDLDPTQLEDFIREKLADREPYYLQADMIFDQCTAAANGESTLEQCLRSFFAHPL